MSPGARRGGRRSGEPVVVEPARFTSYYGRAILKPPVWGELEIAGYLFLGGLAGGSSLLAAGADLTGRPQLRRASRVTAAGALAGSLVALIADLGRPGRFANMLRVAKVTSPMSVGSWILAGYAPAASLAAASEAAGWRWVPRAVRRPLAAAGRPAGLAAAGFAPGLASYTAVLLADTAVPTWHAAHRELPVLFAASAAAAAGGAGMLAAPVAESWPARRFALGGALVDLAVQHGLGGRLGLPGEPLGAGRAGRLLAAARVLTATGALGAVAGRRNRVLAGLAGAALLAGSAATRFGVYEAGVVSAADPRYTVVPQRRRVGT